jgi:serine/threonine protein kinase
MALAPESIPPAIGDWILGDELGRGGSAVVVKATRGVNSETYACKILPLSLIQDTGNFQHFEREITATAQISHPNIVALHDFQSDGGNCYLVMDYCPGGELLHYLGRNGRLPEPLAALVCGQIVAAIAHCHRSGVAHRDIKLENVMFTEFPRLKVGDFGLCGFISQGKLFDTFCGTPCYAAPECLRRCQYDGKLSDVWSLGVLLYTMVVGSFPWDPANVPVMVNAIVSGTYTVPPHVSPGCRNLIEGMLHVDPLTRFNTNQIVTHPWLALAQKSVFYSAKVTVPETARVPGKFSAILDGDRRPMVPFNGHSMESRSVESVRLADVTRGQSLPRVVSLANDRRAKPGQATAPPGQAVRSRFLSSAIRKV